MLANSHGLPDNASSILIAVSQSDNGLIKGIFYNIYLPGPVEFIGLEDLYLKIDLFLDMLEYSIENICAISFNCTFKTWKHNNACMPCRGLLIRYCNNKVFARDNSYIFTLHVNIKFRHHASWQGEILWMDKKECRNFRSEMELMKLLNEVIMYYTGLNEGLTDFQQELLKRVNARAQ